MAKILNSGQSVLLLADPGMGKTTLLDLIFDVPGVRQQYFRDEVKLLRFNLEEGILPTLSPSEQKTIIFFDHTERLSDPDKQNFVYQIKALRDKMRPNISFLFVTNIPLDLPPINHFLLENIYHLPPLSPTDAKDFLEEILKMRQGKLCPMQKKTIINQAGGVPRLIKKLTNLTLDGREWNSDPYVAKFLGSSEDDGEIVGPIKFSQKLSKQEFLLAKFLIEKGDFASREDMIEAVWKNKQYEVNDHALDQMLHRLRQKLATATPKSVLLTFRGRGCKLTF